MVMKHFYPKLKLNRSLEFEVWRQCNMIGSRGADPYGLAVPLLEAGYEVRLVTEWRKAVDEMQWKKRLRSRRYSRADIQLGLFGVRENRRRAMERKIPVQYKRPMVTELVRAVQDGEVPIALVHMGVIHGYNIPHWVVVTRADERKVVFNDPYPPRGRRDLALSHGRFQKIVDDIATRIGMSPSILFVSRR
jgi:hypothetical protein